MSHTVTMKLVVKDANCLHDTMLARGLELREKTTFKSYNTEACDFAYGIPDNSRAFEVGVVIQPDGSYRLLYDLWNGGYGLEAKIGKEGYELIREYESQVVYSQMRNQGYEMSEITLPDGTREITATRYV